MTCTFVGIETETGTETERGINIRSIKTNTEIKVNMINTGKRTNTMIKRKRSLVYISVMLNKKL